MTFLAELGIIAGSTFGIGLVVGLLVLAAGDFD